MSFFLLYKRVKPTWLKTIMFLNVYSVILILNLITIEIKKIKEGIYGEKFYFY
jgi:hypothetical protein